MPCAALCSLTLSSNGAAKSTSQRSPWPPQSRPGPTRSFMLLQEYLETRRVARDAAKAAQLSNDLHGLEAEMRRLNLKLWTQVLHQLLELATGGSSSALQRPPAA